MISIVLTLLHLPVFCLVFPQKSVVDLKDKVGKRDISSYQAMMDYIEDMIEREEERKRQIEEEEDDDEDN